MMTNFVALKINYVKLKKTTDRVCQKMSLCILYQKKVRDLFYLIIFRAKIQIHNLESFQFFGQKVVFCNSVYRWV